MGKILLKINLIFIFLHLYIIHNSFFARAKMYFIFLLRNPLICLQNG
ncbi:hypothetical protein DCCM_4386 [Desulfocucumis palustris]|uniref:Uncharacterized protein n=1 Tax=Desulfocucumis palustris TaxID=1898651 RepID=A0A2L2XHT7_9FIRM|nr:hypothetical protein DCCM_4386 [Desulfocucumis palustris]